VFEESVSCNEHYRLVVNNTSLAILDLMILNSMKNASKNICKKEKNLDAQEFQRK